MKGAGEGGMSLSDVYIKDVEAHPATVDDIFDDIRDLVHQVTYDVIRSFVTMIRSSLNVDDEESMKVADFLDNFCFEM